MPCNCIPLFNVLLLSFTDVTSTEQGADDTKKAHTCPEEVAPV